MKKIVALVLAMVMVLGLATTAFAAKAGNSFDTATNSGWDYVVTPDDPEDAKDKTFATYEIEAVATKDGAKVWWDASNTDLIEEDDDYELGTFVKVNAAAADFVIVEGKTAQYFKQIDELKWAETAVAFELPAKPLDTGDLKCNTMYSTKPAGGTYYFDAENFVIYEAAATGTILNVDGTAVYAKVATTTETTGHNYVVTWADREKDNSVVPTKVYCQACKAEFEFVYGDAEDAFDKWGLDGYVELSKLSGSAKMDDIWVAATLPVNHPALAAVPSVPSVDGDKVESPKTFDAGIAMYVGMSVMAAAGSAVVLKKKD